MSQPTLHAFPYLYGVFTKILIINGLYSVYHIFGTTFNYIYHIFGTTFYRSHHIFGTSLRVLLQNIPLYYYKFCVLIIAFWHNARNVVNR